MMIERMMAEFIIQMEGRRDEDGNLMVYMLPEGDGGGKFEVAGINTKFHHEAAYYLKELIDNRLHEEAEEFAVKYIRDYSQANEPWHDDSRVEAFLMDCRFNRGHHGCTKILQHSLKIANTYHGKIDGLIGPNTLKASNKHTWEDLLPRLLLSRQWYERDVAKRNESSPFWSGLSNRWINAFQLAVSIGDPYNNLV